MDTKSFFDLSLVEYRIGWTNYGTREFVAVTGLDIAIGMTRKSGNYLCEIVPRANALVAEMIDAILAVTALRLFLYIIVQYGTDGQCQIVGIGRRTGLIKASSPSGSASSLRSSYQTRYTTRRFEG